MSAPRVAITTTAERGQDLAEVMRRFGCEPVALPCIETRPEASWTLEKARAEAKQSDWLLITSPRTITTLWPGGGMPPAKAAVVGAATRDTVQAAGGEVAAVGRSGLAELLDKWASSVTGQTVFFPHVSTFDLTRLRPLEEKGARVVTTAVYETNSIPPRSDPVDAAMFASPSAVAGWILSRTLQDLVIAAIGETTADSLTDRGHPPHVIPPHPDFEMLIDLTARHLRDRSPA